MKVLMLVGPTKKALEIVKKLVKLNKDVVVCSPTQYMTGYFKMSQAGKAHESALGKLKWSLKRNASLVIVHAPDLNFNQRSQYELAALAAGYTVELHVMVACDLPKGFYHIYTDETGIQVKAVMRVSNETPKEENHVILPAEARATVRV